MANKPFAIQGADLTLGGVNLQAGTTGVVIPGVTQAANYRVEEVEDTDDQTYQFAPNSEVVVIDAELYSAIVNQNSESGFADFTATTDDEGYIDEIEVNGQGSYNPMSASVAGSTDMYAYVGSDSASDRPLVPQDWIQIPFRPKMRAGEVENIGGGGSSDQLVENDNGNTFALMNTGDMVFDGEGPGGVDRGLVWQYGDNVGGVNSQVRQDEDGLTVRAWTENGEGTYSASVNIVTNQNENLKTWEFDGSGALTFPDGTIQTTAYTGQSGGTGNNSVWIQTFVTDNPVEDIVQGAIAVEYDDSNNIIALFSHFASTGNATYFSIAKFDSSGTRLWQYRYDDEFFTDGWGLAVDNNNGYIYVTGISRPEFGYSTSILMRLDTVDGSVDWAQKYDYGYDSTSAVVDVASDSNPVMVGYASNGTDNFVTVTKVSYVDGSTIWSKKLDGQYDEQATGMAVGPSGEIVAVGYMANLGILDTVATLSAGTNANWTVDVPTASVGGVTFGITFAGGVPTFTNIVDPTGARTQGATLGVITGDVLGGATPADDMTITIDTVTAGDPYDKQLVVKYNSDGTVAWQKAIELDANYDCSGADADIDSLGNIYICGNYNYSGGSAMSIVKFDSSGVKQWSRRVSGNCQDFSNSIVVGPDDCLYLTAVTGVPSNSDYLLVLAKYNLDGTVAWQRLLDNTTTWTFTGAWWMEIGGGSSLAVRNGYLAVAGSFGDPGTQALAMIAQVDTDGTLFAVDNWDYKGASFSGTLSSDASDITVYSSNKIAGIATPTVTTISPSTDNTNFLVGTVSRYTGLSIGDVTFEGNKIIGTGDAYGGNGLNLSPGPGLDADMYFRIHGGDNPSHLHLSVGDTAVYDQYFGNDWKYLKLGLDDVISIGTGGNTWAFGTDGATTFPTMTVPISDNATPTGTGQTLKFKDPTQQAIIYGPPSSADYNSADRVIIQGAPGYTDTTGEGGDIYLWAGPGGSAGGDGGDIKIRAGRGQAAGGGGYLNFQAGNTSTGYGGYINIESGSSNTANQGGNINITANSGGQLNLYAEQDANITLNTVGGANQWVLGSNGTTTLPGAVVKSTVAKTGPMLPTTTGIPSQLNGGMTGLGVADGTYGPFTLGGVTFSVTVAGGSISGYINISSTTPYAVNATIGQLTSADLGDPPGQTTNVGVDAVVQETPTALDLTKSINKLTEGNYTLADGVEGQIMYLVPQHTGITQVNNIGIVVANASSGDATGTEWYLFFDNMSASRIITLIFTDSAWQQTGGLWD